MGGPANHLLNACISFIELLCRLQDDFFFHVFFSGICQQKSSSCFMLVRKAPYPSHTPHAHRVTPHHPMESHATNEVKCTVTSRQVSSIARISSEILSRRTCTCRSLACSVASRFLSFSRELGSSRPLSLHRARAPRELEHAVAYTPTRTYLFFTILSYCMSLD